MMKDNNNPIRILLLFTIMDRGGAETMVMNYYRHIDRQKIQFDFMVHREQRGAYDDEIESMGGRIYRMPPIFPQNFMRYKRMLKEFFDEHDEYQIIHSHMSELGYFAFVEAKRHGIPVRICHAHNAPDFKHENLIQYIKLIPRYYFIRRIRHLTTDFFVCSHIAGLWLFGKKRESNFVFMRNAIETEKFLYNSDEANRTRQEFGVSSQRIICHVGRYNKQKNHSFLIEIFKEIREKDTDSVLLLVGDGDLKKEIEDKVAKLHLQRSVRFLGVRDDVPQLLKASDILLFPSYYEGLSVVLVEAQATGINCVVTDSLASETIICKNQMKLVSLQRSAKEWADIVLNEKSEKREHAIEILKEKGWDVGVNAKWLQDYYLNSMKRNG